MDPSGSSTEQSNEEKGMTVNGHAPLTRSELEQLHGEELPERTAMSLINGNVAIPVNAAVAANVLSDNSVAYANAVQTVDITQSN
jgi:hypothetical protein